MSEQKIKVTLVKSSNNKPMWQKACLKSLGLTRISSFRVFVAHPTIMGNVRKVQHLLKVEEVS